jgi:hypothetical protein
MPVIHARGNLFRFGLALTAVFMVQSAAFSAGAPKTAEEFAASYMAAFNSKDMEGLKKLRFPSSGKSMMQQMMNEISDAEMKGGTKYSSYEILPVPKEMDKAAMGPDGLFYRPNLQPTNLLKLTSKTENGTTTTTIPIGMKDGVLYEVGLEPAPGDTPAYSFGWQRFTPPKCSWSVLLPNEPEPGKASLEKELGKDALNDPDVYGVVKNTASIKTTQHWFRCGEERKRVNDDGNKEIYRVAYTTYAPETLKEWFSDPEKNLDDAVDYTIRQHEGKVVQRKNIDLSGAPGREFEIREADGAVHLARVYWVKDGLFELTFESKKEKPDLDGANKFLNSLQCP